MPSKSSKWKGKAPVLSRGGRSRPRGAPAGSHEKRALSWTKWGTIAGIVSTVIAVISIVFFLADRFVPSEAAPRSPAPQILGEVAPPKPASTCPSGSVCLWPGWESAGKVWVWSPRMGQMIKLPGYLRDHVGSFDAQAPACFVDTESGQKRPAAAQDWSERYTDVGRFGRIMDVIKIAC